MSLFCKHLISQGSALVYTDDFLLMSNSKPHMLQLIKQPHDIANEENLKLAPKNSFFMLPTVTYLGQVFCTITIKLIQSEIAAFQKSPSPTTKIELIRFIGSKTFYSVF